jgi:uncharacterized protein (DUF433 family)
MAVHQRDALSNVVTANKDVLHGTPCFAGTRVPVQTLLDFLETGETIDEFLAAYPYIRREQVLAFLELSRVRQDRQRRIEARTSP